MNLHPYQPYIDQRRLQNALEFVAIEAVNLVGVDINELIKLHDDNCRKILEFVSGFGPRKAFDFYEKLQIEEVSHRSDIRDFVSG